MTNPLPKTKLPVTVMQFSEFNKMSRERAQTLFANQIIVVEGHPHHLEFDLDGLGQLGDLDELRIMHGMPISL